MNRLARTTTTLMVMMTPLAATSRLDAVVKTWDGGAGNTSWLSNANWSPDGVPGANDDVILDVPGDLSVTFFAVNNTVHSLTCAETLTITSGTLSFASASSISGTLVLTGSPTGGIGGAGDLTITGTLDWQAGVMSGTGRTIIGNTGLALISGGINPKTLSRTLENSGSVQVTWGTGLLFSGGTLINNAAMSMDIAPDLSWSGGPLGGNTLINNGTLTKIGGSVMNLDAGTEPIAVQNNGQVLVNAGTLGLNCGGTHTGTFTVANTATLSLNGVHTCSAASSFGGAGLLFVAAGTTTFNGPVNVGFLGVPVGATAAFHSTLNVGSGPVSIAGTAVFSTIDHTFADLNLTGMIDGNTDVIITHALTAIAEWRGTGRTIVNPGATFSVGGTLRRTFINNGVGTVNSLQYYSGTFINNGQVTVGGMTSPGQQGVNRFDNNGTMIQQGNSSTFSPGPNAIQFNNAGLLQVNSGTISIAGGTCTGDIIVANPGPPATVKFNWGSNIIDAAADLTVNGILWVESGTFTCNAPVALGPDSTLRHDGGTAVFNGATNIQGFLNCDSASNAASLTINGPLTINPASSVRVSQNTLSLNSDDIQITGLTVQQGGNFDCNVDCTVTGTITWPSSTISGTGTVIIAPGAIATLGDGNSCIFRGHVDNQGTMNCSSGTHFVAGNGLTNHGILNLNAAGAAMTFRREAGSASATITNQGTINKSSEYPLTFDSANGGMTVINDGTINLTLSTIDMRAALSGGGTVTTSAGTTLRLIGPATMGPFNLSGTAELYYGVPITVASLNATATSKITPQFVRAGGPWMTCTGPITLAGQLNLNGMDGYVPAFNQVIPLIASGSQSGRFSSVIQPDFPSLPFNLMLLPEYLGDGVYLRALRAGDVNHDIVVNIDDLVMVIQHWGNCPAPPTICDGDANADGVVNIDDLVKVVTFWGM